MPVGVIIRPWSDDEHAAIMQGLSDRKTARQIAAELGRPISSIKNKILRLTESPERAAKLRAAKRIYNDSRYMPDYYAHYHDKDHILRNNRPSAEQWQERNRRLAAPLTPNCIILGDPPKGYSALDRRQA